jgi:hypothetical protein
VADIGRRLRPAAFGGVANCGKWFVGIADCQRLGDCTTSAGPQAAGNWSRIQNAIGNLRGLLATYLTGVTVGTGSFVPAFVNTFAVPLWELGEFIPAGQDRGVVQNESRSVATPIE